MGIKNTSAPALKWGLIRKCILDTLLMRDTSCKETRIAPLCMSLIKEFNCISSTASTQNITSNDTSWHEASWELPRQNRRLDFSGAATNPTLWVRSVTVEERGCRVLTAYEWRAQLMWAKSSAPPYDVTTKVSGIASLRCEKAACSCKSHTARYNRTRHENSGPYTCWSGSGRHTETFQHWSTVTIYDWSNQQYYTVGVNSGVLRCGDSAGSSVTEMQARSNMPAFLDAQSVWKAFQSAWNVPSVSDKLEQ